ncbi:long-chain acyl-CoA synthetase [Melghirimyces profundicolus]|uniref:Acyl-CoA synthetase n=1 Tax=Melghirimyces profundicolus TaxID=1242148 RepID=A0A2T6BG01_9BACL|nr:long-chain fatty acid--CoA ligase [Melghirimyces profundicolus]PTX54993.1 long-chain acyl-CoA synthetase [Melghirimyces profundicolus]
MKPKNLLDMVRRTVERYPEKDALMFKDGGAYRGISYREMWKQVKEAALGLTRLGVGPGDKVAILSENNPMWPVTDLAIASLGAVSVPIYPTQTAEQTAYILKNAECKAAVVENGDQLRKVKSTGVQLGGVVVMKPEPGFSDGEGVLSFDALRKEGRDHPRARWEEEWKAIDGEQLVTIIHTSGTTGPPKGVMLTHDNFLANTEGVHFWILELLPEDVTLSYLPLSHVFERMAGQFMPLKVGATIAYAESIDTIQQNMVEVRPTVMTSVPRLFEKVYARVQEQIELASPLRKKIFNWAVDVGKRRYEHLMKARVDQLLLGDPLDPNLGIQFDLANRLVYRKIKERVGGRLRGMVSGGAPLNPEIAEFFWSIDLPVLEGYGLTETSPVIASNPMLRPKIGTVGKPLPNLEVRTAPDGEVLVKGPSVMKGYYNNPEATAKTIRDGWLHTGDLGELDEDGYLKIIDRKKNILILSTGKNVAPQPVENTINNSAYIAQSVLIGNGRKFVIAMVVPDFENLIPWAKKKGLPAQDPENLANHPEVQHLLNEEVKRLTKDFAAFEQPKKVTVCGKEWTIEGGELTPTMKVRLKVVEEKYGDLIEKAYADAAGAGVEAAVGRV